MAVGLEINSEITKYMFKFCHQSAAQPHNIKAGFKFFENVGKFK